LDELLLYKLGVLLFERIDYFKSIKLRQLYFDLYWRIYKSKTQSCLNSIKI